MAHWLTSVVFNPVNLLNGVLVLTGWTAWVMASNYLSLNSVPARKMLEGQPVMVMYNGQILESNLKHVYYTVNDLLLLLRQQGIFDPSQVEIAIIEFDGKLSILNKSQPQSRPQLQSQPSSPFSAPQWTPTSHYVGQEVILHGQVMDQNLKELGLNK